MDTMSAMLLDEPGQPLRHATLPIPVPSGDDLLLEVAACGVCRTDLHIADGDLPPHRLPLILGHEIVGKVVATGRRARRFGLGARVGVPWLAGTCGTCRYCLAGKENLCDQAVFTGYDRDGGFAQYVLADQRYCVALPAAGDDGHIAPLLCAGLIGYRAYRMAGRAQLIGLYGFGAAAHIIAQLGVQDRRQLYAFVRPGDEAARQFALAQGVRWAGPSDLAPPDLLDAAILFAPCGALVPQALAGLAKGAVVVCAGIHMSDIPSFPYRLLWGERCIRSVANLTRADGVNLMRRVQARPVSTTITRYRLEAANQALEDLRAGRLNGAAVICPNRSDLPLSE